MKPDEREFLQLCAERVGLYGEVAPGIRGVFPRDLINEPGFPMHYKRAWYLLGKWCAKDWYEYGVTLDLGWMLEKGMEAAEAQEQRA